MRNPEGRKFFRPRVLKLRSDFVLTAFQDAKPCLILIVARVLSQLTPYSSFSEQKHSYLQWIRAGFGDTTELISVQDIIYCKAEHKYTSVVTQHRKFFIRRSIKDLEQQLDPNRFWRIHRGLIVRVDQVQKAQRDLRGCYTIKLRDCPDILRSSRNYGKLFKLM